MSNNAVLAYESGEKPISKWTKADILSVCKNVESEKLALLKKSQLKGLKRLLKYSSWHHTSCHFNETDFYMVDLETIEDSTIDELEQLLKVEKEKKPEQIKARCKYLEWSGTRKHPKATERVSDGYIQGNWFYTGTIKKSIMANGFKVLEYL